VGAASAKEIGRLFQWSNEIVQRTLKPLFASQQLIQSDNDADQKEPLIFSNKMINLYKG
jgi:hypothetical protein